jgi:predicted ATP-grasp superfamily ATP-dependent carboligase
MNVLVLATQSLDDRKALCVIRALGRAGVQFTVASDAFKGGPFHSRFTRRRAYVPHPANGQDDYLAALNVILAGQKFDVVLPTDDYTTLAISAIQHKLNGPPGLPVPPRKSAEVCKDKQVASELAAGLGLSVPESFCPHDQGELESRAGNLTYPCVIKPRTGAGAVGMDIVGSRRELIEAYAALPESFDEVYDFSRPLVQEFIPGHIHEVCALFNRGEPRALLTQRRLLKYPAAGGAGIYNETTDEPDLKEMAVTLLRALNWHGPAQVEFQRDERTGHPYFLEINGRFWGTLDLSIAAGMNFPLLACRMAAEGDIEPHLHFQVGLRYRWPFPFAILHAMETGRWGGAAKDFLIPRRSTHSDIELTDPLPTIMEVFYAAQRLKRRRFKTLRKTRNWSELVAGSRTGRD